MFDNGTNALTVTALLRSTWSRICPRRPEISPMTDPKYSAGAVISTSMIGSRMTGSHFLAASLNAILAAIL